MSTPQDPTTRKKQKVRATRKLTAWRKKQEEQGGGAAKKVEKKAK
jgi:hypothetical protein